MELERVAREDIAVMRQERLRTSALPIVPRFHARLTERAKAFLIVEPLELGETPRPLGYSLSLERTHG